MTQDQPARVDVVVVGAGQAGLAAAYHLRRAGLTPAGSPGRKDGGFVVLDDAPGPGGAWQHRWDSLTMQHTHAVHELPGMPLPAIDPAERAPTAVARYFAAYERELGLPVVRPVRVRAVRDAGDHGTGAAVPDLLVETDRGVWRPRALVNATGTWQRPFWPAYPVVRRSPGSVVGATGLPLTEEYQHGIDRGVLVPLPIFARIVPDGVEWDLADVPPAPRHQDADVLLWATGFRAGLDHLAPLRLRRHGGGIVMAGTQVVSDPRVQLVGYGPSASTVGANRAGREAARNARRLLGG